MKLAVMLWLLLALTVPMLWASKHPVPLEAKIDSAKCLECHSDKGKRQVCAFRDRHRLLELP